MAQKTAKELQLLDAHNNNISPITGYDSIYFEEMSNGAVIRKSLAKNIPTQYYVYYPDKLDKFMAAVPTDMDCDFKLYTESNSDEWPICNYVKLVRKDTYPKGIFRAYLNTFGDMLNHSEFLEDDFVHRLNNKDEHVTGIKTFQHRLEFDDNGAGAGRPVNGVNINGIMGRMAGNDNFAIFGYGTATDGGYLEIATGDNGNEPIYVTQYTGSNPFSPAATRVNEIILMNNLGNQNFNSVNARGDVSIDKNLRVVQNTSVQGYLKVSGNTSLHGTLDVNGETSIRSAVRVHNNVSITGNTSIGGYLRVQGDASIFGDINIKGNTSFRGGIDIYGDTSSAGDISTRGWLRVMGDTSVFGDFNVTGNTSLRGAVRVHNNVSITGDTSIGGYLKVSGNTSLHGTLDVTGDTSIRGSVRAHNNVSIMGDTSIGGYLRVQGDASIFGDINIKGNTSFRGGIDIYGDTSSAGDISTRGWLRVMGDTSVHGDFNVTGDTSMRGYLKVWGDASIKGNTSVGGYLKVSGNTSLHGTLDVTGDTSIRGAVRVHNNVSITGNTSIGGYLKVSGNTSLHGTLDVTGDTSIRGAVRVHNNVSITGNTSIGGYLRTQGDTSLFGKLDVVGNTSVGSKLDVVGDTSIRGAFRVHNNVSITGNTSIGGYLRTQGDTSLFGKLDVVGNTSVGGKLDVVGDTSIRGAVRVHNNVSITGDTSIGGYLKVSGNTSLHGTLDVTGDTSIRGSVRVHNNVSITGNTSIGGYLKVSGNTSLHGTLDVTGDTSIRGSVRVHNNVSITGNTSIGGYLRTQGDTSLFGKLDVVDNTSVGGTLDVVGNTSIRGAFRVHNNVSITGNTSIGGYLKVSGDTSLHGYLNTAGNTFLQSNTSIGGTLDAVGNTSVHGNFNVIGDTSIRGAFRVHNNVSITGNTSIGGYLKVSGDTSLHGYLNAAGNTFLQKNVSIGGTLDAVGNTSVHGNFNALSDASVRGSLTVWGNTIFRGTLGVHGDISTNTSVIAWGNTSTKGFVQSRDTMTLTNGLPWGTYTDKDFGGRLYANGVAFRPTEAGTDAGGVLFRHISGTDDGELTLWTGDNGNEPIYVRQYGQNGVAAHSITLMNANGNQNFNNVSGGIFEGTRYISTVATGTAPLTVASTTLVNNLNADYLDGTHKTGLFTVFGAGDTARQTKLTIGETTKQYVVNFATNSSTLCFGGPTDIVKVNEVSKCEDPALATGVGDGSKGLTLHWVYNNGYPCSYGNLLRVIDTHNGGGELLLEWKGQNAASPWNTTGRIYYRSKRDQDDNWSNGPDTDKNWQTVAWVSELYHHIGLSAAGGNISANVGHDKTTGVAKLETDNTLDYGSSFDVIVAMDRDVSGHLLGWDKQTHKLPAKYSHPNVANLNSSNNNTANVTNNNVALPINLITTGDTTRVVTGLTRDVSGHIRGWTTSDILVEHNPPYNNTDTNGTAEYPVTVVVMPDVTQKNTSVYLGSVLPALYDVTYDVSGHMIGAQGAYYKVLHPGPNTGSATQANINMATGVAGTNTVNLGYGGNFNAYNSVVRDASGHVHRGTLTTYNMPDYPKKVYLTASLNGTQRPVLAHNAISDDAISNTTIELYGNSNCKVSDSGFYVSSDERLKEEIKNVPIPEDIPYVREFTWKETGKRSIGFIAQEFEKLDMPDIVYTDPETDLKTLNYDAALSLYCAWLRKQYEDLRREVEDLKKKIH